jgi:hypothetical protein
MVFRRLPLAAVALALMLGVVAQRVAHAADSFRVTSELSRGGEVFARPVLIVKPDEAGTLEVGGEHGFAYRVRVDASGDHTLRVSLHLQVGDRTASPVIVVRPSEPASVVEGDLSVKVLVEPQ